jgi:hypothetical protein
MAYSKGDKVIAFDNCVYIILEKLSFDLYRACCDGGQSEGVVELKDINGHACENHGESHSELGTHLITVAIKGGKVESRRLICDACYNEMKELFGN